jgi:peptidoglycan/LPS O-acetylase OafA/YrhL
MKNHFRQRLPNRRFRRLFPAAVATVTLAASAPLATPASAHAQRPPRVAAHQSAGKIPTLLNVDTTRGVRGQTNGAT